MILLGKEEQELMQLVERGILLARLSRKLPRFLCPESACLPSHSFDDGALQEIGDLRDQKDQSLNLSKNSIDDIITERGDNMKVVQVENLVDTD